MKKLLLFVGILSFISSFASAQDVLTNNSQDELNNNKIISRFHQFDISNYYTPDIIRNELELHLNFDSNYGKNKTQRLNNEDENNSSSNFGFKNDSRISFKRITNTRKRITYLGSGLNVKTEHLSSEFNNSLETDNDLWKKSTSVGNIMLDLYWKERRYLNSPFFFLYSLGGELSRDYSINNENKTYMPKRDALYKQTDNQLRVETAVGVGWGRIEDVTDARQAIYIIDALRKNGVLNRDLSVQEMFDFSQLISSVKNKRFLDSRLHLIDELTTVDNYLKNKGVIADGGAAYFANLNDMWQYGALFERKSGYEVTFNANPWFTWGKNYRLEKDSNNPQENINTTQPYNSQLYMASLDFSYHKPVKNVWQHNFYTRVHYDATFSSMLVEPQNRYLIHGGYELGYYPNTRTHLSFSLSGTSNWHNYHSDVVNRKISVVTRQINSGFRIHYYFSPQLSISGSFALINSLHDYENDRKDSSLNAHFDAHLIYKFF